mgnify:FL=1
MSAVQAALDLLLRDPTNPRSVAFQIDRLVEDLELIEDEQALPLARAIAEQLAGLDLDALFVDSRMPLVRLLTRLGTDLRETHGAIDRAYFQRKSPGRNVQWVQWNGGEETW